MTGFRRHLASMLVFLGHVGQTEERLLRLVRTIPVPSELRRANGGPISSIPLVVKADEIHSEAKESA